MSDRDNWLEEARRLIAPYATGWREKIADALKEAYEEGVARGIDCGSAESSCTPRCHRHGVVEAMERVAKLYERGLHAERQRIADLIGLCETAWGVIANASGGDWKRESRVWRGAAELWRDRYHRILAAGAAALEEK